MALVKVDADGFARADFAGILQFFIDGFRVLWGPDIYLGEDTKDRVFLDSFTGVVDETYKALEGDYSSKSPATAIGDALTRNVKINGLRRRSATNSLVDLRVVGQNGTTIPNGVAVDNNGKRWAFLDTSFAIDASGEVIKTAQCTEAGAITAAAGTITRIGTPTRGWQKVTNNAAATAGVAVQTDAELRMLQSESTMLPNQSVTEAVLGAVADVPGVQRHRIYENWTSVTDEIGIPGHTIAVVAEGGDADAIARAIHVKKTSGTGTFARDADHFNGSGPADLAKSQAIEDRVAPLPGGTTVTVLDQKGMPTDINFIRPPRVPIKVEVTLTPLAGYIDATKAQIQNLIAYYITGGAPAELAAILANLGLPTAGLAIGEDVYPGRLYTAANLDNVGRGITYFVTQIRVAKVGADFPDGDPDPITKPVTIEFNEVAACDPGDVTVIDAAP